MTLNTLKNVNFAFMTMELSQILHWLIIAFILADFAIETWLTVLIVKASKWPVPKVLEGLYDDEKYRKQQAYASEKRRVDLLSSVISLALTLGLFAFGGLAWMDELVRGVSDNEIIRSLLFIGAIVIVGLIIGIPISIYDTFSIEARYGFNKTTPGTFVGDFFKSLLLTVIIGGGILALANWIYILNPKWFWLIAFAVITGISLFFTYFYSEIIVPLFNKQKPLEDGELRTAIEEFSRKAGFQLKNIYVMDESKRTTKANAYFTGFGKKKRVVLFDTLIEQLTTEEIVAVLAHEIGHYKKGHVVKSLVTDSLRNLVTFWLVSLFLGSETIAAAAGCAEPSFYVNLIVFGMLLTPLGIILDLIDNCVSRKHEWQADAFAKHYGCGPAEASGLKKMSAHALSNLTPHPIVVKFEYSHPTLADRVEYLTDGESIL